MSKILHCQVIAAFLLLPFFPTNLYAQTNVSGPISTNTNWDIAGSPYIVTGDLLVEDSTTLTIDPGVVVKFDTTRSLVIRGTLRAIGNDNNNILFTSNATNPAPGDWGYIDFDEESQSYDSTSGQGCFMQYCKFEYGGKFIYPQSLSNVIGIYSTAPRISNCTFSNNQSVLINCEITTVPPNLPLIISDNIFENNGPPIPYYIGLGEPCEIVIFCWKLQFNNNIIRNNDLSGASAGLIWIFGGEASFYGNQIIDNKSDVILLNLLFFTGAATCNIICDNVASTIINLKSNFLNNVVANNTANNSFPPNLRSLLESSGIIDISYNSFVGNRLHNTKLLQLGYTISSFDHNTIVNNFFSQEVEGIVSTQFTNFDFHHNNFFRNIVDSASNIYYLKAGNTPLSDDFIAENNYWGTTSSSEIDDLIYDYFDTLTIGVVDYTPYLQNPDVDAPVSPPSNFTKTYLGDDTYYLSWSANPESDIAGYKLYWNTSDCCSFLNSLDIGNVLAYTITSVDSNTSFAIAAYDNDMVDGSYRCEGHESWFMCDTLFGAIGTNVGTFRATSLHFITYPNPCSENLTIAFQNIQASSAQFVIRNMFGRQMLSFDEGNLNGSFVKTIDLSKLADGIYFLEAKINDERIGVKVIKE